MTKKNTSPEADRMHTPASPSVRARKRKAVRQPLPVAESDLPPPYSGSFPFINRELSWLKFNERVLHEAFSENNPLLERVRFYGIFTSNLDEFFMKRVGGLKRQVAAGIVSRKLSDQSPKEQLVSIRKAVLPLIQEQARCFQEALQPALRDEKIELLLWKELSEEERVSLAAYFSKNIFPALTPMALDPGHPFPFLSNLSTSLGVLVQHPDRPDEPLFARIKIPQFFSSWVPVSSTTTERTRLISLHELMVNNLETLFPGMIILDSMFFRVTRNADIERDEEDAEDLLEMITDELKQRRFANLVRLEHGPHPNERIMAILLDNLEISPEDIFELPMLLEYYDLKPLLELPRPTLKFASWKPVTPPALIDTESDIFSVIQSGDILVHHPYESFSASVERFIQSAVQDPDVITIKMTLYRTGKESPFVPLLIQAADAGKQVVCLVEVKAMFDEERNIYLAQELEKGGVHVVYGIVGLKTHCKTALVVRKERDSVRCYAHIGTGNYHAVTSKLYTDLGLLTCDPEITSDVVNLFHYLTGRSLFKEFRKLLVAPINMKQRFVEMIDREIAHHQSGNPSRIIAKMNSLADGDIIIKLYEASKAGVRVDLFVRGVCSLIPQHEGLSENIRVTSIIGRFLEHSRVFYFRNGAEDPLDGDFLIGSADWMTRNLQARVEAIVPLNDASLRARIWEFFEIMMNDTRQAWSMKADGSYIRVQESEGNELRGTQEALMLRAEQTGQRFTP